MTRDGTHYVGDGCDPPHVLPEPPLVAPRREGPAKLAGNSTTPDALREQIAAAIARSEGLGLTRAQHPVGWAQVDHTAAAVMDVLRRNGRL